MKDKKTYAHSNKDIIPEQFSDKFPPEVLNTVNKENTTF